MTATHGAHVIVIGNEKGGSGKSTIALHLSVGLMQFGFRVAVADFDERQRSLSRYLDNRLAFTQRGSASLQCPTIYDPPDSRADGSRVARLQRVDSDLRALARQTDFLVIDTPGSVTELANLAHSFADTLVTPMNDSLIDLDVLARIASGSMVATDPSQYSLLVLEQRRRRLREHGAGIDWIVVRNRLAPLNSANNQRVGKVLDALAPKLGFRLAPGIAERVIYRELFHIGATVLDPIDIVAGLRLTMSHIAARIEVRDLVNALWLPHLTTDAVAPQGSVRSDGPA